MGGSDGAPDSGAVAGETILPDLPARRRGVSLRRSKAAEARVGPPPAVVSPYPGSGTAPPAPPPPPNQVDVAWSPPAGVATAGEVAELQADLRRAQAQVGQLTEELRRATEEVAACASREAGTRSELAEAVTEHQRLLAERDRSDAAAVQELQSRVAKAEAANADLTRRVEEMRTALDQARTSDAAARVELAAAAAERVRLLEQQQVHERAAATDQPVDGFRQEIERLGAELADARIVAERAQKWARDEGARRAEAEAKATDVAGHVVRAEERQKAAAQRAGELTAVVQKLQSELTAWRNLGGAIADTLGVRISPTAEPHATLLKAVEGLGSDVDALRGDLSRTDERAERLAADLSAAKKEAEALRSAARQVQASSTQGHRSTKTAPAEGSPDHLLDLLRSATSELS